MKKHKSNHRQQPLKTSRNNARIKRLRGEEVKKDSAITNGKMSSLPASFEHSSADTHRQESPRVEKLDEMPDYETTNGVFDGATRMPTTVSNLETHPDCNIQTICPLVETVPDFHNAETWVQIPSKPERKEHVLSNSGVSSSLVQDTAQNIHKNVGNEYALQTNCDVETICPLGETIPDFPRKNNDGIECPECHCFVHLEWKPQTPHTNPNSVSDGRGAHRSFTGEDKSGDIHKTKAQMNWEVGKEQELEFLGKLQQNCTESFIFDTEQLFKQIRQNEYRRGKEEAMDFVRKTIKIQKEDINSLKDSGNKGIRIFELELLERELFGGTA